LFYGAHLRMTGRAVFDPWHLCYSTTVEDRALSRQQLEATLGVCQPEWAVVTCSVGDDPSPLVVKLTGPKARLLICILADLVCEEQ
jgi:hypothetical protein